jgi:hypothetical protein
MGRVARVMGWSGVLLLAGAVVNVMVAWGSSRWCDHWPGGDHFLDSRQWDEALEGLPSDAEEYLRASSFDHPDSSIAKLSDDSLWCTRVEYKRSSEPKGMSRSRSHEVIQFGLPFRSMQYAQQNWMRYASYPGFDSWRVQGLAGGWPPEPKGSFGLPSLGAPRHWYPMTILPLRFAINSVVFAALLYPMVLMPGVIARRFRRRRGMCGKCGYPVGVSPVCTECGAGVARQRESV